MVRQQWLQDKTSEKVRPRHTEDEEVRRSAEKWWRVPVKCKKQKSIAENCYRCQAGKEDCWRKRNHLMLLKRMLLFLMLVRKRIISSQKRHSDSVRFFQLTQLYILSTTLYTGNKMLLRFVLRKRALVMLDHKNARQQLCLHLIFWKYRKLAALFNVVVTIKMLWLFNKGKFVFLSKLLTSMH